MEIEIKCPHCNKKLKHKFVTIGDSIIEFWDNPEDEK